jgi:hypothetical protein
MRVVLRIIIVIALLWIGSLLSGYGVLIGSQESAVGLALECKYLTAREIVTAQFIHTDNEIIGQSDCPLLHKAESVIGNDE